MTAAPTDTPMIRMSAVDKYFGSLHVLREIDLEVPRGQVVVVLGPSGSGKSTLCRAINRLEPIDAGRIEIDGVPLPSEGRALAELRADVGMVFQQFNLFAHKTILENVTLSRQYRSDRTNECLLSASDDWGSISMARSSRRAPPHGRSSSSTACK